MSEKLLTIGIPTYNSPDTLERIFETLKDEEGEFDILISDDSTNEEVHDVVTKYQKAIPNLIYHKNEKSLGYSGNVCMLYDLAKTRYIWFFCDDDEIVPGTVKKVIDSINKYSPTILCLSTEWVDVLGRLKVAGPASDVVHDSMGDLKDYRPLMRMTFVSLIVAERILPLDEIRKTNYKDNVFVQLTIALHLLSHKFKYVEVAGAAVRRFVGFKYGEFFKFLVVDEMKAVHAIKHKFDNRKFISWSKSLLLDNFVLYLSRKIGLFYYTSPPTRDTVRLMFKYFGLWALILLAFMPVYYLVPKFFIAAVYKMALYKVHGSKDGEKIFQANIDRAFKDRRDAGFVSYK